MVFCIIGAHFHLHIFCGIGLLPAFVYCIILCFMGTLHLFTIYHCTVNTINIGTTRVVHHLCYLCFVLCTVIFNVSAKRVNLCADRSFKAFFSYNLVIATCFSSILNFYCLLCLLRVVFVPFITPEKFLLQDTWIDCSRGNSLTVDFWNLQKYWYRYHFFYK